jgi:SAM-dependent methyltransferase
MKTTEEMVQLNREQAKFYDSIQTAEAEVGHGGYTENESANALTRFWAGLRYQQQDALKHAGIEVAMRSSHNRWVDSKKGGDFLELGCFSGSPSTFYLSEASCTYLGVDLSPLAVDALNKKFAERNLSHKAQAKALDFLTMSEDQKFDLIYAHGVLHHFENPEPLFQKLFRLCKPGGALLFVEPSAVNPLYRFIRSIYRPFQSDAAWEWPFRPLTVAALERHFLPQEGFGWGRWSLPLSVIIGLPIIGSWLAPLYIKTAEGEINAGWHDRVWHNSMVTALYRVRA